VHDEEEFENEDCQDLRPLLEYLSDGGPIRVKQSDLRPTIEAKLPEVKCLVVTLPQPVAGVMSYRFDELLDMVQRAAERRGYTLDRLHLRWDPGREGAGTAADGTSRFRVIAVSVEDS
jgi:hypothetical protein